MRRNPYLLRCYARPEGGHLIAVCVDLDLMVRADDLHSAKEQLANAIKSYLASLDKENLKDLLPRPAPFPIQADYLMVCLICNVRKFVRNVQDGFDIFCEIATPQSFKVTLCA